MRRRAGRSNGQRPGELPAPPATAPRARPQAGPLRSRRQPPAPVPVPEPAAAAAAAPLRRRARRPPSRTLLGPRRPGDAPAAPRGSVTLDMLRQAWPGVVEAIKAKGRVAAIVIGNASVASFDEGVLTLRFPRQGDVKGFQGSRYEDLLKQAIATMFGVNVVIRAVTGGGDAPSAARRPVQPSAPSAPNGQQPSGYGQPSSGAAPPAGQPSGQPRVVPPPDYPPDATAAAGARCRRARRRPVSHTVRNPATPPMAGPPRGERDPARAQARPRSAARSAPAATCRRCRRPRHRMTRILTLMTRTCPPRRSTSSPAWPSYSAN